MTSGIDRFPGILAAVAALLALGADAGPGARPPETIVPGDTMLGALRRRGMAIGRFSAWWLLGALGDLHDDWPPSTDEVTELLDELRWYRWDAHEPEGGWRLQLLVENETEGVAWAINAADRD